MCSICLKARPKALRPRVHGYPDARHGRLEAARLVVERYREAGRARPPIHRHHGERYEEDRRRALDAGMDGFAVKPIGKSEVCHLFATFVDAKIDE